MTPSPNVTWPSAAITTLPSRRTQRTVVDRIRAELLRFILIRKYSERRHSVLGPPGPHYPGFGFVTPQRVAHPPPGATRLARIRELRGRWRTCPFERRSAWRAATSSPHH